MLAKMLHMVLDGSDRAEGGITEEAMVEGFPANGVLLIGVGEGNVGPLLHVIPRTVTGWDALDKQTAESCVIEMEGLALAMVSGGGEGIFPRAAEEVEGEGAQVRDSLGPWTIGVMGEAGDQGLKDHDVDGPDVRGSGVLILPSLEEGLEWET